jgi:hypothetical protein
MFNVSHPQRVKKRAPVLDDCTSTMVFPRIGPVQLAVLEHLVVVAQCDRAVARLSKRSWHGGWTHLRLSRRVRAETVQGLIDKGLVQPCCSYHGPHDNVRISRLGVQLLEWVRGEGEILA